MLITIFTPLFNRARYLERIYQSILNQNDLEIEWIIVDDGSNDRPKSIIDPWIAEANFKIGKVDEMILNYNSIYENQNIDIYYRDLARLLSVMKDNVSSFEIQKKILDPILNSPSKLQLLAAELEIILLIRFNKIDEAKLSISKLLKRPDITFEQKNRLDLIDKVYNSNAK